MSPYEEKLARDFVNLTETQIFDLYWGKIEERPSVSGVVEALEKQGLLEALIRTDWKNDGFDRDGLYLTKSAEKYQVFIGERGGRHGVIEFSDLRSACAAWVDSAFNQLLYTAPDSKIR